MALLALDLSTPTAIANAALAHLDHRAHLSNLDTATGKHAELIRQFYQTAIDETTESNDWSFARKITPYSAPTAGTDYRPEPYPYGFLLPTECLAVRALYPAGVAHLPQNTLGFDKRGRYVFLQCEQIELVFTARIVDLAACSATFTHAIAYKLAYHLALPITQNAKAKDKMMQGYRMARATALKDDSDHGGMSAGDHQRQTPPSNIAARQG